MCALSNTSLMMGRRSVRSWLSFLAQLLLLQIVYAAPPSVYNLKVYNNFEITISDYGQRTSGKVNILINQLAYLLRREIQSWPAEGINRHDGRSYNPDEFAGELWNIYGDWRLVQSSDNAGTGPCQYQMVAAAWGVLQWLREWRDLDWVPNARFTAVWRDPDLPGGIATSHGSLGSVQTGLDTGLPVESGNATQRPGLPLTSRSQARGVTYGSGQSGKLIERSEDLQSGDYNTTQEDGFSELNATALGAPPPDPWRREKRDEHNRENMWRQTISYYCDDKVPVRDLLDVTLDCYLRHAFDRESDEDADQFSTVLHDPVICGKEGEPQIFLNGKSEPGVENDWVSWADVYLTMSTIREYVYKSAGFDDETGKAHRRWVSSVRSFRQTHWMGGEARYDSVTVGWWGKPEGVAPVMGNVGFNGTGRSVGGHFRNRTSVSEVTDSTL